MKSTALAGADSERISDNNNNNKYTSAHSENRFLLEI